MNDSARGYAVIEIAEEADPQELVAPAGVEMIWVVADQGDKLVDAVKNLSQ